MTKSRSARSRLVIRLVGGGAGGASYGGSGAQSGEYIRVRELINAGRFSEAEVLLGRKAASERTAEWHFLYGHIMLHKGWMMEARQEFETGLPDGPVQQ